MEKCQSHQNRNFSPSQSYTQKSQRPSIDYNDVKQMYVEVCACVSSGSLGCNSLVFITQAHVCMLIVSQCLKICAVDFDQFDGNPISNVTLLLLGSMRLNH